MMVLTVDFAALLLAALTVGAMFAVYLIFNPAGLDATTYVSQHQLGVRALNVWWRWHLVRFSAGLAGLCLLILAALRSRG